MLIWKSEEEMKQGYGMTSRVSKGASACELNVPFLILSYSQKRYFSNLKDFFFFEAHSDKFKIKQRQHDGPRFKGSGGKTKY
jgi:hypothetical protein